jgi:hypothetical protein
VGFSRLYFYPTVTTTSAIVIIMVEGLEGFTVSVALDILYNRSLHFDNSKARDLPSLVALSVLSIIDANLAMIRLVGVLA